MILATHAVAGAAAALLFKKHPILAFCAAFASHFLLDRIPHWDYSMPSIFEHVPLSQWTAQKKKLFMKDLLKAGADTALGFAIIFAASNFVWGRIDFILVLGAIGGILPDFLQLVYYMHRQGPIVVLQRFHEWAHAKISLKDKPVPGIISQAALVSLLVFLIRVII